MERTASLKTSVFNLVSTVVGGGVLSLPFTFSVMGIIFGPLALLLSAVMSDFSIYLLLSMSRRKGDVGYEDIAAKTLGEPARIFLLILLFLLTFLCASAYFVLAADLVQPIVTAFIDPLLGVQVARLYVMAGFVCVVGPLSFFKKLSALRFTSFLSIVSIFVLGLVLLYKLVNKPATHFIAHFGKNGTNSSAANNHNDGTLVLSVKLWPDSIQDFMYALPISTVAYLCHFNVLPTNRELIKPTKSRIKQMIHSTIGICLGLYLMIAFCGYLFSLDLTCGDILNNYKNEDPVVSVGRIGLVTTLAMSFPLLVMPCRNTVQRIIALIQGKKEEDGQQQLLRTVDGSTPARTEADAASSLLLPTDGLMSPIGTFIADSPANFPPRSNNTVLQRYSTFGGEGREDIGREVERPARPQKKPETSMAMHTLLTVAILVGCSQVATQVTSVVQIWSILGSSVSILIAYILPCSMYISLRRQSRANGDEGNTSTLFWAWMLLIFASIASILSTWQAIVQLHRPNCPHSVKNK
jgi:amino acid permease|eukprot:g8755.t1